MELDRTEIIIRKRTSAELLDLSLLVVKRHFFKLAISGAIIGLPLMVLNVLLLQWMVTEDAVLAAENTFAPDAVVWWRFVSHLCVLTTMQFPISSFPIILFLGAQIFFLPISFGELLRQLGKLLLSMFFVLGVLRLGLLGIVVELLIRGQSQFNIWEGLLLFLLFPFCIVTRTFWPFAPEIIGLERCPLRARNKDEISYSTRRKSLHGPLQGDLLNRMFAATFYGLLLLLMTVGTALFVKAIISGDWGWNWLVGMLVLPLSLWLVGIFLAVFRYLSSIDCRISLEGWEIELRLRAEASRLQQGEHVGANTRASVAGGANL